MIRTPRRAVIAACAAAMSVLVIAGCSGGDEAASTTTAAPVTTVAETASPTTAPTAPTAPTSTTSGYDEWCGLAQHLEDTDNFLDSETIADPAAVESGLTTWIADLQTALPVAPEAIRSDVATTIDVMTSLDKAFAAVGYRVLDLDFGAVDGLDTDLAVAAANIEAFNLDTCGIVANDESIDGGDGFDLTAGSVREQAAARFVAQGFTEDEAACLVDQIGLLPVDGSTGTVAAADAFTACGVTAERLLELGG